MRPVPTRRALASLAVLLLAGCGASADVPMLCNALSNEQMVGTGTSVSETRQFTVDFSSVAKDLTGSHVTTQLLLTSLALDAGQGIQNFDFLDSVKVSLAVPGGAPVTLVEYQRTAATSGHLALQPSGTPDLLQLVPSGKFDVQVQLTGQMPAGGWSFSAQACAHAHASATL